MQYLASYTGKPFRVGLMHFGEGLLTIDSQTWDLVKANHVVQLSLDDGSLSFLPGRGPAEEPSKSEAVPPRLPVPESIQVPVVGEDADKSDDKSKGKLKSKAKLP
jgi:hypothetical protein